MAVSSGGGVRGLQDDNVASIEEAFTLSTGFGCHKRKEVAEA